MSDVQGVFNAISDKYDLLDSFISLGMDHAWRRRAVEILSQYSFDSILDNGSGTGKLASEIQKAFPKAKFYLLDLTETMMERNQVSKAEKIIGSADKVPLPDSSVDLITAAFLTRNVPTLSGYMRECNRVLKPGGKLLNLDIFMPESWFRAIFAFYFFNIVPRFGNLVTSSASYTYLASSVRNFVSPGTFTRTMQDAGFSIILKEPHAMGSVWIHLGEKI